MAAHKLLGNDNRAYGNNPLLLKREGQPSYGWSDTVSVIGATMVPSTARLSISRLILVPALVTLAVTLLRLVGELNRWSSVLFNREAGGPGAVVGIVWLVPVFGIYFAFRLVHAGHGPKSRGRAIACGFAALVVLVGLYAAILKLALPILTTVVLINVAAVAAATVAYWGWPQLGRIEVVYGLAARLPVALVMLVAMLAGWGTHYELGPPGLPQMGLLTKWMTIGLLPQLVFWIAFTVLFGSLFGSLALMFRRSPGSFLDSI
ncbi:MAG: hypothetical protein AB1898_00420 [Acidobacteriota bacterium]